MIGIALGLAITFWIVFKPMSVLYCCLQEFTKYLKIIIACSSSDFLSRFIILSR